MAPSFMSVGFNATAALMSWRLAQSKAFNVYTYWPVNEVVFATQMFGDGPFLPNQLDLQNLPAGQQPMAVVLIVVNSIKDITRVCRKIERVVDKKTLILVDLSGGVGALQRLVRPHFSKNVVSGIICDYNVRIRSVQRHKAYVDQYGDAKSTGPRPAVHIEPQFKQLPVIVSALELARMTAIAPKNQAAFYALQWERAIAIVAFELLSVVLGTTTVEQLVSDVVAKPILEGIIGEMTSIATALGVKSLPSASQFVKSSSAIVRRAPQEFKYPGASRLFYEYYERANLQLDLLVLAPILLADELSKCGPTPYLESLYAVCAHLVRLNDSPSALLMRADGRVQPQEAAAPVAAPSAAETRAANEREKQLAGREQQLHIDQALLGRQREEVQAQLAEHSKAASARERELSERIEQLELAAQDSTTSSERLAERERVLQERERALEHRERHAERDRRRSIQGPNGNGPDFGPNGPPVNLPNGPHGPPMGPVGVSVPVGPPNGHNGHPHGPPNGPPNGFGYPGAPVPYGPGPYGPNAYGPGPGPGVGPAYPPNGSGPRGPPRQGYGRPPWAGPRGPGGRPGPPPGPEGKMRQTRTGSMSSITSHAYPGTPQVNGGGSFSQSFQLDSIISTANDRYGMVGRSKRGSTNALSSDHVSSPRPFAHGRGSTSRNSPPRGAARTSSVPNILISDMPKFEVTDFNFTFDQEQGSNSASGNSHSTGMRSEPGTPPTPALDPGYKAPAFEL